MKTSRRTGQRTFLLMVGRLLAGCCLAGIVSTWQIAAAAAPLRNVLKDHPSPYLALHGGDPVAWQDWGPGPVKRARDEHKLLYLSIGYFSCHWCHVMQRESYQDKAIAAVLNANFIPVKIDRELESALDARMIDFAERTRGRAGWPLNVFLTPQGDPLYAVLYLPPKHFRRVLDQLADLWEKDREELIDLARRDARPTDGPGEPTLDRERVVRYVEAMKLDVMTRQRAGLLRCAATGQDAPFAGGIEASQLKPDAAIGSRDQYCRCHSCCVLIPKVLIIDS